MFRRVFAAICLLVASASLFASVSIGSYQFNISGKTMEYAVRDMVANDEGTVLESVEALEEAMARKVQVLNNLRVFNSVKASYTLAGDVAHLVFDIDDAHTILVVPYPKYDSNYGTKIGVKMFNSNVAGTLADFAGSVDLTFPDGAWDSPSYGVELELDDLYFSNGANLDMKAKVEGQNSDIKKYDTSFDLRDLPLFSLGFNFNGRARTLDVGELNRFGFSVDGIGGDRVSITPSLAVADYTVKTKSSYITPALEIEGLEFGRFRPSLHLDLTMKKNVEEGEDSYSPQNYSMTSVLELTEIASLTTTFRNYLWGVTEGEYRILNELDYVIDDDSTAVFQGNLYMDEDMIPEFFDAGLGVKQTIRIGEKVTVTPKLVEYLRYYFPVTMGDPGTFAHFYSLSATAKGSSINWKGNFREGVRYSITLDESWIQNYSTRCIMDGVYDHIEVELHDIWFKYLNPSARVILNYANNGVDDDNDYNWLMYDKEATFGEYLRGIRNKDIKDRNMFATVVNLNFMSYFPMPSLFDFVDCYANAFFDYACVKATEVTDVKNYYAAGLEGIGILKGYPSYPIRVSVGLDLEKFKKYLDHEGGSGFYEIFIGLGFFF